jgi:hypothetical protein
MIRINLKIAKYCTVGLLILPVFLFFIGWLKIYFSIPLSAALLYSSWVYAKNQTTTYQYISYTNAAVILGLLIVWVALSGAGGFGFRHTDLQKIDAIQHDLITKNLPVSYLSLGHKLYLSAYLGYFISVPIVFGPMVPWPAIEVLMAVYNLFILCFVAVWLLTLVQKWHWSVMILFILFSGFEVFAYILEYGWGSIHYIISHFTSVEPFWSTVVNQNTKLFFRSNTHALFWSPQHALACWLGAGILGYEVFIEKNSKYAPLYLVALFFWSPFAALGLAPYFIYSVFRFKISKYFGIHNLLLIPVFAVLAWFVTSVPVGEYDKGFIFQPQPRILFYLRDFSNFLVFYITEIGIWLVLLAWYFYRSKQYILLKGLIGIAIFMFFAPMYKLGKWNDFGQWVAMPSLFYLVVLFAKAFSDSTKFLKLFWWLCLVLCAWDASHFIVKSYQNSPFTKKTMVKTELKTEDLLKTSTKNNWPLAQSFAPEDASFFKYMAKKPYSNVDK